MNINGIELSHEKQYLKDVLTEIENQLRDNRNKGKLKKADIYTQRKAMWDELPHLVRSFDDAVELAQEDLASRLQENNYFQIYKTIMRLEKMKESPYFGRIDFLEKGEAYADKIYIGIATLKDKMHDILVYDWRSPIAGMFYDFELGEAYFDCPAGRIMGNITLKRQYKIINGEFDKIFNSDVKIDDDMLQYILSRNADDRMKTIVSTIQREQNKIIRDDKHKILIVQGPAGSGKTSIALHRVVYLLYKFNTTIKSDNIVIFSPNKLFNDYISDVIPELGEENTYRTTFREYAISMIDPDYEIEDLGDQIEYLLSASNPADRILSIRIKSSQAFVELLKRYVSFLESGGWLFNDYVYDGRIIISGEEISDMFQNKYSKLSIAMRLKKIRSEAGSRLDAFKKAKRAEILEKLKNENSDANMKELKAMARIKAYGELKHLYERLNMSVSPDIMEMYYRLFEKKDLFLMLSGEDKNLIDSFDTISGLTLKGYKDRKISYEDIAPILFLKNIMGYGVNTSIIKHVIIDESQDYSPIQYEVFKQLFKNTSMTVLGDVNQRVNLHGGIMDYDTLLNIFGNSNSAVVNINKSYRSTKEIFDFYSNLLPAKDEVEHIGRHGEAPLIIKAEDNESMIKEIANDIKTLMQKGMKSIAIICKTAGEAAFVYNSLAGEAEVSLVTKNTEVFSSGVVVVPSYLSKGLEFDAVIAYDISDSNYCDESHQGLLYVTLTRALHVLHIYYTGKLSRFLSELGE